MTPTSTATMKPPDVTTAAGRSWPPWPKAHPEDIEAVADVLRGDAWSGVDAPQVRAFEQRFAHSCRVRRAVTVGNGTQALVLGLRALGIGPGDEVIVPAYTFLATASAVLLVGAEPVFADLDPDTYCLSADAVAATVTDRTTAVIAVHLGGHPADLDALRSVCAARQLALIEDCAHAHGAVWSGRPVGGAGRFGAWSFGSAKNMSAGEGGAITTDDDELADRVDSLRNQGRVPGGAWYEHHRLGWNSRITAIQGALLGNALTRLPGEVRAREQAAEMLDCGLAGLPGLRPMRRDPRVHLHAHHLYLLRVTTSESDRDALVAALVAAGVPASSGYPTPLYDQPVFADRGRPRPDLPRTEQACREALWIPQQVLLAGPDRMTGILDVVREASGQGACDATGVALVPSTTT